jgi:hypothetical protein
MNGTQVNNKLENMWKEAGVDYLLCYHAICLEEPRKITKKSVKITGLRDEIWSRDLEC